MWTPDALARLTGFKAAMKARGLPFSDEDVVLWSKPSVDLPAWLATKPPHTAIFGWHEGIAGKILAAAAAAGIEVPRQLSVVGFDSTMFCESTTPRLTAVRQPIREMAEQAAQLLLDLIEGQSPSQLSHYFPCTLDVRDSTCPPASRRA